MTKTPPDQIAGHSGPDRARHHETRAPPGRTGFFAGQQVNHQTVTRSSSASAHDRGEVVRSPEPLVSCEHGQLQA
jgi:hypothetical protein